MPISKQDMSTRGWDDLDFIVISGDAYVDHPSFGSAIISRYVENLGYTVGILPQPDWKNVEAFRKLGRPNLAFLVTAGNLDSMVNHYSVHRRPRKTDPYSPGGKTGYRPDRASIVYTSMAKQAYKGVPVILGGVEASLRRLAHYDYWSGKVRKSILLDSKADLLVYGMGEAPLKRITEQLEKGIPVKEIRGVPGTVYVCKQEEVPPGAVALPAYEEVSSNKEKFAESFQIQSKNTDYLNGSVLFEPVGQRAVVQNPPAPPLGQKALDSVYSLPFVREAHPSYASSGGVPALKEVKYSITSHRGCFGSCSFCAITFHQGSRIRGRSKDSIVKEAEGFIGKSDFKGNIHDIGGPTANFRVPSCMLQEDKGMCKNKKCLFPKICKNLRVDHQEYLDILRSVRNLKGIKRVFIRSGIRFDYLLEDRDQSFLHELCKFHVSGQLKLAPEHVSKTVLRRMGKPEYKVYEEFRKRFRETNKRLGKKQYIIPYFMTSHPGSSLKEAIQLALQLKKEGFIPEQVQDFYPTPGTRSTCMYYTELDPNTMEHVYVPKSDKEKHMQRALVHFHKPENRKLVEQALKKAGREDVIGFSKDCLIKPSGRGHERKKYRKNKKA